MIDQELKKRVESIIFAAGKKVEIVDIAKLAGTRDLTLAEEALRELQHEYQKEDRSFTIVNEGTTWKLSVRDRYLSVVSKMVTHTELSKTVMETLAVIAYKAPMMQSSLIKVRTNKAYDHLVTLEKQGYISRVKKGRTKEIRLAEKFFTYFDVPPERLKEKFRTVQELENAIEYKEKEIEQQKQEFEQKKDEVQKREEHTKEQTAQEIQKLDCEIQEAPTIELFDSKGNEVTLETYRTSEFVDIPKPFKSGPVKEIKEKLNNMDIVKTKRPAEEQGKYIGDLEVYERKKKIKKGEPAEGTAETEQKSEQPTQPAPQSTPTQEKVPAPTTDMGNTGGFNFPPEVEAMIEKKVSELLKPEEPEKEEENAVK